MHRLVLALFATTSLTAAISQVASAADLKLVYKGPPSTIEPWSWSGFYVGAHVGAGWGTKAQTIFFDGIGVPTFNGSTHTVNGILGGVQVGYNWQPVDRLVWGVEAQFSWADLEGQGSCSFVADNNCRTRADWLGTAAIRLGWTADKALIYVKGGGAWIHDKHEIDVFRLADTLNTADETRRGWMFGAGVEYALTGNWSAKVEYNYLDFGTRTVTLNNAAAALINDPNVPITQRTHLIKFGVNYRLWPGPVAGSAQSAYAANRALPTKAPPAPFVAAWNWTGFYIGAHVGAGWGTKAQTISVDAGGPTLTLNDSNHTVNGILGGIQVGYNWQPADRLVWGVEAQFSWANLEGQGSCSIFAENNCRTRADWLGSAAIRLGWTADKALIYVKGGGAWIHDKYEIDLFRLAGTLNTADETRWGWMFGAGVEYALTANWSAKVEYNYLDFGTRTVTLSNAAAALISDPNVPITQRTHLMKFGVNYRPWPGLGAAPAPVVPTASWTGFYIGAHAGAGWGTKEQTISVDNGGPPLTLNDSTHTVNGILGGIQVGYNWQPADRWVWGVEAQFSWADLEGNGSCGIIAINNCRTKADWLGTAAVRLGWTADKALIYVKGGGAWVHDKYEIDAVGAPGTFGSSSETRWGWMFGTGVEYAVTPNWSAKVEYNYLDFGTRTVFLPSDLGPLGPVAAGTFNDPNVEIRQRIHLIKLGVNYRFAPGPIAVRY